MAQAFRGCTSLEQIGELDCSAVNVLSYAFNEDRSLKQFGGLRNLGKKLYIYKCELFSIHS